MLVVFVAIGVYVVYRIARGGGGGSVAGVVAPTTPASITSDLAELPRDVRDYVMSFVVDPASQPGDFEEGAFVLRGRFPRAAMRLEAIAAEKRAGLGKTVVSAGLSTVVRGADRGRESVFGMRSCETSLMTSSWTCCQCRHAFRNSTPSCPNCEHRRCG